MIYAKASKQILLMTVFSIIAIIFVGLLPWSGTTFKTLNHNGDETKVSYFYTYLKYQNIEMSSEMEDVADSLVAIYAMAWITFLFCMFALLGLLMVRMDYNKKIGQVFIFVGALAFIFAVIGLAMHGVAVYQMNQVQEKANDGGSSDTTFFFAYNYIPLIMNILILIFGVMLFMGSGLPLLRVIMEPSPYYGGGAPPPATYYYPPPTPAPPPAPAPYPPPQYPPPAPPAPVYEPAPPSLQPAPAAPVASAQPASPPPQTEMRPDGSVVAEPKEVPKEAETQICLHCLNIVPTGTKFCPKCGSKII